MKKIELEFQEPKMIKAVELFNIVLEGSNYNLDQFVKNDSLVFPDEMLEELQDTLREFVDIVPEVIRKMDDKEVFWNIFNELDVYKNNSKFILWLMKYIEAINKPIKEAMFIKTMDIETLRKMTNYCFENLIIRNIGKKRIDKTIGDVKQICILKKIILTFTEMIVIENLSKENALDNMERMFDIKKTYCEIWWNLIEENEEKLWKIMMTKKCERIEDKLDYLLELIEEKEQIGTILGI